MNKPTEPTAPATHWYRQPIAWLGIVITIAILAGCIWTIAISTAYTDHPTHGDAPTLLGMPMPASGASAEQP